MEMEATWRRFRPTLAAAAALCALLGVISSAEAGACGPGMGTDQTIGTLAGAAAGGLIGNQFGKSSGKDVATIAGVVAGGVIGNQVGESMDASNCAPPAAQPAYVPPPQPTAYVPPPPPEPVAVAPAPPEVVVYQAPPAPVVYAPPQPRAGFVWVSGFWQWDGRRYHWREGYWERERPGFEYVPAAWVLVGGGWRLTPGHWVEARFERPHGPPRCPPGLARQGRC
jgi:glycine zipper 2TM protein/YXWGXW repeat-containing protein